jgi:hypothetical protein
MVRFFTWHDVEIMFEENRLLWPKEWTDVKVYSDCVIIYYNSNGHDIEESHQYLKQLFTKNYNIKEEKILIDFSQLYLDVFFEESEEDVRKERRYAPLFKDAYFSVKKLQTETEKLPGARILAFHSYKGGVGRTLSLISLLRECTAQYPEKKILVIDGDLEAPGLTWMLTEQGQSSISYVDILSVMNFDEDIDSAVKRMAAEIQTSMITVETDKMRVEQFFVPAYRDRKQVMNIFSDSERVLISKDNKFFISETISKLGDELGAELVLIDLRAGITEYSAPFLFDPRVEKYFVSSTSLQSVKGLNQILGQIYGKAKSELLNSEIFLTMVPKTMEEGRIIEIEDQILENIEDDFDSTTDTFLREDYFKQFEFDEALVHLGDFSSVCELLQNKDISKVMRQIAEDLFRADIKNKTVFEEDEARRILKKLNGIAEEEVTAEGNSSTNILVTSAIREITRSFRNSLPKIVVAGAKGSGKTYIYKQLLDAKSWRRFRQFIEHTEDMECDDALIMPLIASLNLKNMNPLISECVSNINERLEGLLIKPRYVNDTFRILREQLEEKNNLTRGQWRQKWVDAILSPFGKEFQTLSELDAFLETKRRKIVLIVDGLEDLCMDMQFHQSKEWKYVLSSVCQDIVNELDNLDYGNIGIIVFARKDMLSEAIETNYEQFRNLYIKYELNWSQTEALRLALWLAVRAYPDLAGNIDISSASKEVIVDKLTKLWGLKLGKTDSKEAFSDRWIIAALSDFTGQLQARDIVRFLKYSSASYADANLLYKDRLIMPIDIRNAIAPCSKDKVDEIKSEMSYIYEILKKFMEMSEDKKTLPMTLDKIQLTGEQISRLEVQGLLKISDKKYYLPEIIRLALGFRYEKGARPKVLSLLVK